MNNSEYSLNCNSEVVGMSSLFRMVLKVAWSALEVLKIPLVLSTFTSLCGFLKAWSALAMVDSHYFPLFSFPGQFYLTQSQSNLLAHCFWWSLLVFSFKTILERVQTCWEESETYFRRLGFSVSWEYLADKENHREESPQPISFISSSGFGSLLFLWDCFCKCFSLHLCTF